MQERFGQLGKMIAGRALPPFGVLRAEHEIPMVDAQSGDLYFEPDIAKEAARGPLGMLGDLTREPCLLELIQSTPGPIQVRDNIRKQLTLDHALALETQKSKEPRRPLLRLWMLSAGRPEQVLDGYEFQPAPSLPKGVWVRSKLDAMGLVVLRDLPRTRYTLLVRLFGRGAVLEEAIVDLLALPEDAIERAIAYQPLVALRFEVSHDPNPNAEAQRFLMKTQDLYEQWEARVKREGKAEGQSEGRLDLLAGIYQQRFGPMPEPLREALAKKVAHDTGHKWAILLSTASANEIAAALHDGRNGA